MEACAGISPRKRLRRIQSRSRSEGDVTTRVSISNDKRALFEGSSQTWMECQAEIARLIGVSSGSRVSYRPRFGSSGARRCSRESSGTDIPVEFISAGFFFQNHEDTMQKAGGVFCSAQETKILKSMIGRALDNGDSKLRDNPFLLQILRKMHATCEQCDPPEGVFLMTLTTNF